MSHRAIDTPKSKELSKSKHKHYPATSERSVLMAGEYGDKNMWSHNDWNARAELRLESEARSRPQLHDRVAALLVKMFQNLTL